MQSQHEVPGSERFELVADACLFTATTSAIGMSVAGGIASLFGDSPVPVVIGIASSLLILAAGVIGPVGTWLLHGRRFSGPAVLGAIVGMPISGALYLVLVLLTAPLGWLVSPISTSEFAGPVTLLVLASTAFAAVIVWLVVDAVRDLRPTQREHRPVDAVRLVSAVLFTGFVAAVAASMRSVGAEIAEAPVFALVAGVSGAVVVACADAATYFAARGRAGAHTTAA